MKRMFVCTNHTVISTKRCTLTDIYLLTGNFKNTKSPKTTNIIEKTADTTGLRIERSVINMDNFYCCDLVIIFIFISGLIFVNPSATTLSPLFMPLKTSRFPLFRIPVSISIFLIILFSTIL